MSAIAGTVKALLERVEFVRQEYGSCNIAKAYVVLRDDADCHEFKIAVKRDLAKQLAEYLAAWDESGEPPPVEITLTVPEDE